MATDRDGADNTMGMLRPPVISSKVSGILDRALFRKTVPLAAAAVYDRRKIAEYRRQLISDKRILKADRLQIIRPHPDHAQAESGIKCLLLAPVVKHDAPETWGSLIQEGVKKQDLGIVPFTLEIDYDYWTYDDVMQSIIPPEERDEHDGIPAGFNTAGHVAHLNLRDAYLPYKKIIAEVLVDKNPHVKTVINKVGDVGTESEFRTFGYEVLAGPEDLNVEVRENDCLFRFDYSKVYWNSKLHGEHTRLIDLFQPGEVVCDLMAGIGPFAVPAGKKGVFVWANDYNPDSYKSLADGIKNNKVGEFVRPFNRDGRVFIREAADSVYTASSQGECAIVRPSRTQKRNQRRQVEGRATSGDTAPSDDGSKKIPIPPTISHFVMNLPASAITFLSHFRGLYEGREQLFAPHTATQLPMVHCHCFSTKQLEHDDKAPILDVCQRVSAELGAEIIPGDPGTTGQAMVHNVRTVAPNKDMFCVSFRLPAEVAFAPRPKE